MQSACAVDPTQRVPLAKADTTLLASWPGTHLQKHCRHSPRPHLCLAGTTHLQKPCRHSPRPLHWLAHVGSTGVSHARPTMPSHLRAHTVRFGPHAVQFRPHATHSAVVQAAGWAGGPIRTQGPRCRPTCTQAAYGLCRNHLHAVYTGQATVHQQCGSGCSSPSCTHTGQASSLPIVQIKPEGNPQCGAGQMPCTVQ